LTGNNFFDKPEEIIKSLKKTDVISIFFPYIKKTILIDKRSTGDEGSVILLTDMARTPRERILSLQTLRPNFPAIENILLIPWTRYVISLKDSGVWEAICDTLEKSATKSDTTDKIFEQLTQLEKRSLINVINGSEFKTIWTRDN